VHSDDDLRDEPRIQLAIVGEYENASCPRILAGARDLLYLANAGSRPVPGRKAGSWRRFQTVIGGWHVLVPRSPKVSSECTSYSPRIAGHAWKGSGT